MNGLVDIENKGASSKASRCVQDAVITSVPLMSCAWICWLTCEAAALPMANEVLPNVPPVRKPKGPALPLTDAVTNFLMFEMVLVACCTFSSNEKYCASIFSESDASGMDLVRVRM